MATPTKHQHPEHRGEPVHVGPYSIYAGGTMDLEPEDLDHADILVALTDRLPHTDFGRTYQIITAPLEDFGGVPRGWKEFLQQEIVPRLAENKRLLAFCGASHGRTGTFLASLIALLEDKHKTPDPIEAVRQRHCREAVETVEQAEGIFKIRNEQLPEKYRTEFRIQELRRQEAMRAMMKSTPKLR